MFELVNENLENKMDEALHYIANQLNKSRHNSKPVLLHSFKLAMTLYLNNYSEDIVLAGILHDLIEDTDISSIDIESKYGRKIKEIVEAVSFDPKIEDKLEQAYQMFKKCYNYGYDALIVKCADLLDNINYVHLIEDLDTRNNILKKYQLFLEISKEIIETEPIYKLLKNKYENTK